MKAIDLGLPSGLKWADCNIGAEKETDYGLYFQWGDTEGYDDVYHSTWETCPGNEGNATYNVDSITEWDKANLNNGVLKPEVDAATVHLGSNWRMPTLDDIAELYRNTINELVEIDGVRGRKFTSKSDPSKYIFFPFGGFITGGTFHHHGVEFNLWVSSAYPSNSKGACAMCANKSVVCRVPNYRCYAFSVRGVCKNI